MMKNQAESGQEININNTSMGGVSQFLLYWNLNDTQQCRQTFVEIVMLYIRRREHCESLRKTLKTVFL